MKRFNFSSNEIDQHKSDRKQWLYFVRRREVEIIFSLFPGKVFPMALELGAGAGVQSVIISKFCEKLICTELDKESYAWVGKTILERSLPNVEYKLCDAEDLSQFDDCSFDLIFSSNLLEHIPNLNLCLSECKRVLKSDGIMLHTMPSRWWKFFNASLGMLRWRKLPSVHGVSGNNMSELWNFGRKIWIPRFESNGLEVQDTVALPFYVGHGNRFIRIIKAGNRIGLQASYLYIVRKKAPANQALDSEA